MATETSKQETKLLEHVPCICGSELIGISTKDYFCKHCALYFEGDTKIYHCKKSNNYHLKPREICQACAETAIAAKKMYPYQYGPAKGVPLEYTGLGITPHPMMTGMNIFQSDNITTDNPMTNMMTMNAMTNMNAMNMVRLGFGMTSDANMQTMNVCMMPMNMVAMGMNPMINMNAMNMASFGFTDNEDVKFDFDQTDTQQQQILTQTIQFDKENEADNIDSKYLFDSTVINSGLRHHIKACKLEECQSLKRISIVMKKYHCYINKLEQINDDNDYIYDNDDNYKNKHLLNDYNHLLITHYMEFEDIYNILIEISNCNSICLLTKCVMIRRNRRNRSKENNNLYLNQDNQSIVKHQLLDKIHSYYFHSFDTGYKFTRKERQCMLNGDEPQEMKTNNDDNHDDNKTDVDDPNIVDLHVRRINDLIGNKKRKYKDIDELNRSECISNKYKTDGMEQENMKEIEMDYSFGVRYFYWKWYENNNDTKDYAHPLSGTSIDPQLQETNIKLKDLYIGPKYKNFKAELLLNKLCVISASQWQILLIQATNHMDTDLVRQFSCPRTISAVCYDMKYGTKMSMNHVIALMIYCNFDLQSKFTETFRRKSKQETNEEMKERHRNFHYLGKLLRECVECFGMKNIWKINDENDPNYMPGDQNKMNVWHGINRQFTFKSLIGLIKGPMSTTTDYSVAVNFCGNKGMILNLSIDIEYWQIKWNEGEEAQYRLSCFDMQWISDYPNEQEIFFIGGLNPFEIDAIIETSIATNYKVYIKGLKQMTYNMTGSGFYTNNILTEPPITKQEKVIVFRLLSHKIFEHYPDMKNAHNFQSCPGYFKIITNKHCESIVCITFNSKEQQKHSGILEHCQLHDSLFKYDNEWIKLDLIIKIFPNTQEIIYLCEWDKESTFLKQSLIYNSILQFATNNKNAKLRGISIQINPQFYQEMMIYIQSYKQKFTMYGWNIDMIFVSDVIPSSVQIVMMNWKPKM